MRRENGGLGGGFFFFSVAVGFLYFSSTGWIWGLNFFFAGEMFSLVHVGLVRSWVRCVSGAGSIRLTVFSFTCCEFLSCW
jgi:hypothetical protein